MAPRDDNAGITVGDLIRQLSVFPHDAELYMGGLHFYRLTQRGDKLVQLEFDEQFIATRMIRS